MSEDILERAKKALIDDDMTYEDYDECISLLIAEVEANQIMLRQFQVHEDQTHAAMEGLLGNSDNFIELAREMKEEVGRLRSENNRINKLREAEINQAGAAERVYLEAMMVKDARIKELDADRIAYRNLGSRIEDLETYIKRLEAAFLEAEAAAQYYEGCLLDCQADDGPAFFGWPGRDYQAMSDKSTIDMYRKEARKELERIKEAKE